MVKQLNLLHLFAVALLSLSCSTVSHTVHKVGVRTTTGVVARAGEEMETESNWEVFREALPANLKMIEGLLYIDGSNEDLLLALIKGYGGFGFGVSETLYLEDRLKQNGNEYYRNQATSHYAKGVKYGMRYLDENGVTYQELIKAFRGKEGELFDYLNRRLYARSVEDLEAVFFLAQSWGGLINTQKTNLILVSQLGIVKSLFDWACYHNPHINYGACDIFYGSYEAGRPSTLGGSLEKAKKHFMRAIENHPHNLLARVIYLEAMVLPMKDKQEYLKQKADLEKLFEERNKRLLSNPVAVAIEDESNQKEEQPSPRLNLLNAIAQKRFKTIVKYEKDLF